jgi:hypothetical protein
MAAYSSENQNIDITSIISEIRTNIKKKGATAKELSFKDNFDEAFLLLIPKNNDIIDILRNSWEIQPNKPIIGNKLVVFIKKIIRKLIRFYIIPIVKEQNAFNYSIFRILEENCEMRIEIENLSDKITKLKEQIKNNTGTKYG